MILLQLNEATAAQRRIPFYAVDIGDGFTPETGLSSFVVDVSENGGARAAGAGSDPSEIDATNMPGSYYYEATAAELSTLGFLAISIKHANMRDFLAIAQVVAFDPYVAYSIHSAADVWTAGSRALSTPGDYMANVSALALEATVAALNNFDYSSEQVTVATNNDKSGYSISGTITTLDALVTDLESNHGATSWTTATGFSTHNAADIWTAGSRELSTPANYMANVASLALEATVAALNNFNPASDQVIVTTNNDKTGYTVSTVSDKTGYSISGTITTFDAMDTNLDTQHGAGSWLTGGGGAGANILVIPSIPKNIDLADTKTVRIALYLTDQNDDLPTTGEITPGTIKIERSADGGTSWSTIRDDVACSEHAGGIYYDETFSSGNGYASADMIKITFKGQLVTISANNHEICDATDGMVFITRMDSGLSGGGPSAGDIADAVWEELIADHQTGTTFGGKNQLVVPSETIADYRATGFATSGALTTHDGKLDTVDINVDLLIYDSDRVVYGGSIWLDDTAANTNTVLGIDGTWYNPVSTLAAALTIATALNVQSLVLMNNSSISLSQSFADWEITGFGHENIITLNSQSVDNARIINCTVTGTQAGSDCVLLEDCYLDSIIDLYPCAVDCRIIGNLTIVAADDIHFIHCSSVVAGNSTPILTLSAGNTDISIRSYSGGWEIKSMTSDHTISLETDGQVIINADCTGGALTLRGNMTITDNSGNVTITQGAALNRDVIADGVWDELLTGITHNLATSAGKRLRQLGEGVAGTVNDSGASTTEFITDLTEIRDDFYNDQLVRFTSGNLSGHVRVIVDYDGGTKTITTDEAMVEPPDDGISFDLIPTHIHPKGELGDVVWDELMSGHTVSGSAGEYFRRALGLMFDNAAWEFTFTGDNQTGGGIWLYDTPANLATHNKSTGKVGEYNFSCTFSGDKPQVMKISKVS